MKEAWHEDLVRVARAGDAIDASLQPAGGTSSRALGLTRMLRTFCPSHPLYVCRLLDLPEPESAAIDQIGESHPGWAEMLARLRPSEAGGSVFLPPGEKEWEGLVLVQEKIVYRGRDLGTVALAVSEKNVADHTRAQVILAAFAGQLAPRLGFQGEEQEGAKWRQELVEQERLAQVAELAGPLVHESNNFLNVVLLQVAVMEMEVSGQLRTQLGVIRRQGAEFKAKVRDFQSRRQSLQPEPRLISLNQVIRDALQAWEGEGTAVTLELAADLPPVLGAAVDVKRLLRFLRTSMGWESVSEGLSLTTERAGSKVKLSFRGPSSDADKDSARPESLEWQASQGLVRRLKAKMTREDTADTGTVITLEFLTDRSESSSDY